MTATVAQCRARFQGMRPFFLSVCGLAAGLSGLAHAHPKPGEAEARYLANEGVMVTQGDLKILFDPIFDNGFGNFPLVPEEMRAAMFAGEAPFSGVDAIFVSHAHGDHFAAADTNTYLKAHPAVRLVAPQQAIDFMREAEGWDASLLDRVTAFSMSLDEGAQTFAIGDIKVQAMRVVHTGDWPNVHNMVYRVTLDTKASVMHLGDADGSEGNFSVHRETLDSEATNVAFVPFWWLDEGPDEARELMNADEVVGIHVAIEVPGWLKASGADFFAEPGETRIITISSDHE
ncbi:MBL fold metallo-hydrolase [Parvularcula sp. ZS-1/3]|uniref:MBL fold metallo-hydrolase n=1 Tax=Parvularcula mediterranea TaxID=2732508 RepID=A0A7Y3RNM4_9PROT|nr:MBL fold metallo-hydrolase [Parvularcula mediterranea]NNU17305.1 MBL fold metallo-hydrolase [Parvularcula mediterranea]